LDHALAPAVRENRPAFDRTHNNERVTINSARDGRLVKKLNKLLAIG